MLLNFLFCLSGKLALADVDIASMKSAQSLLTSLGLIEFSFSLLQTLTAEMSMVRIRAGSGF